MEKAGLPIDAEPEQLVETRLLTPISLSWLFSSALVERVAGQDTWRW
jgi:hypothetical protein